MKLIILLISLSLLMACNKAEPSDRALIDITCVDSKGQVTMVMKKVSAPVEFLKKSRSSQCVLTKSK